MLGLIALVGLMNLPVPYGGDQALFAVFARDLDAGRVLYRDMWDSKQPGIFLAYWLAGRLFGFSQPGFRVFELLSMLAFSFVLMRTARGYLESRAARLALPLFSVGLYELVAKSKTLGQVEMLAGAPIYLALWWAVGRAGSPPSPARAFASGFAGGLVVWLKLFFLPILGVVWLLGWVRSWREIGTRSLARFALPVAVGFALPVLGLAAWLAAQGVLGEVGWTFFVYPRLMAEMAGTNPEEMRTTLRWFGLYFAAPLLFATAWLVVAAIRRRGEAMLTGALGWLAVGAELIVLQRSWWNYYTLILVVPLAILAAGGVDAASRLAGAARRTLVAACAVLALFPACGRSWEKLGPLLRHRLALASDDRQAFRGEVHTLFAQSLEQAAHVAAEIPEGQTIYVFGDPQILYLASRRYAIPMNGWSPEVWTPEVWERALAQLRRAPPDHIYLAGNFEKWSQSRYPPLYDFLGENYETARAEPVGTWLRRIRPREP